MDNSAGKLRILVVGVETNVLEAITGCLKKFTVTKVTNAEQYETLCGDLADGQHDLIACGPESIGVPVLELAQGFHTLCPATNLIFATNRAADMQVKSLTKNGFEQAYLLPADQRLLREFLTGLERSKTGQGEKLYRGVSLIDFGAEDRLDFDVSVFLPMNNKYVKVVSEGAALSARNLEKFQKHQVAKVYIDQDNVKRFYKYSAEKLKALNAPDGALSETERQQRLQESVRRLVVGLFDSSVDASFDSGRELMNDTTQIITEMVGTSATHDLHNEMMKAMGQTADDSSRGTRVSTFAALFEMALNYKKTQAAAIAGLFFEVGLAELPADLQRKPIAQMTDEERKTYQSYPEASLRLLQNKRMVVTPDVQAAIQQHRERVDGKGFPNALPAHKISPLAQVVAIAVRFDELTFGGDGSVLRSAPEILKKIADEGFASREIVMNLVRAVTPPAAAPAAKSA